MGAPPNGWFIRENPIRLMIQGYTYFRKPPFNKINGLSTSKGRENGDLITQHGD